MFKLNKMSFRSNLLFGAANIALKTAAISTFSIVNAGHAFAQNTETVVVTGSRIPQAGLVAPSPVTSVGQQEALYQGTTNVENLLNSLPSVFPSQTNFEGNGSTGTATVDLRGLGAGRTLVLVDGLRLAPGDPTSPYPDINQIPAGLIERVEVLTGGGSAVYGSDAVAGVVNFKLRKDFEGVELSTTFAGYNHNNGDPKMAALFKAAGGEAAGFKGGPDSVWDGFQTNATLLIGTNTADNKGNVTGYLGYHRVAQVLQSHRDYSACSVSNYKSKPKASNGQQPYDAFKCAGSPNYSLFYGLTGPKAGEYFFMGSGGKLVPFTGASNQYFNYGPYNSINRPDTRYEGGFFAHYKVDPMLEVYSSLMFTDDRSSWQAAPTAAFLGAGLDSGAVDVSCSNPLLTGTDFKSFFCNSPTDTAQVFIGRRNVEQGGRITEYKHATYRIVLGLKGNITDDLQYDISGQHSRTDYAQAYLNDWSKQRVQNALLVDSSGKCEIYASDKACVPLDIFHGFGAITPAMQTYVGNHLQEAGYTEENVLSASIGGATGIRMPSSNEPVSFSVGAEYRDDYLYDLTSIANQQGDGYGAGGKSLGMPKSGFSVREFFGELRLPIIEDAYLAKNLSLELGYRLADYNASGTNSTYKAGIVWQPLDLLRLRASYNHAAKAPNVLDLYSPQNVVLGTFSDPCAGASPSATASACAKSGVSSSQYGKLLNCPAAQCNILSGGNPLLKPEDADTYTIGAVITPDEWLPGFTLTADYFSIKVNHAIGSIASTVSLSGCLNGNTALCSNVHRDSSGYLFTPTGYVVSTGLNAGWLKTSGLDLEANYQTGLDVLGLENAGGLSLNYVSTFLSDYSVSPYPGACQYVNGSSVGNCGGTTAPSGATVSTSYDCVGMFGEACGTPNPRYRHKLRATWSTPWSINLSLDWRYVSNVIYSGNTSNPFLRKGGYLATASYGPSNPVVAGDHIPDFSWFDLAANWEVSEKIGITTGVNNVFDKDPPLMASGGVVSGHVNANTFMNLYDPLGRYLFINVTVRN